MRNRLQIDAPAKINIHLDILGLRSDGFHDLSSLFQLISLHDTLEVTIRQSITFSCSLTCAVNVPFERNTLYRAAKYFFLAVGKTAEVHVTCRKRIPLQAGLGGGSSDAAALLAALNRFYDEPLSSEELMQVGKNIGSDVPFFIDAAAALVKGKGDIVRPIEPRDDLSGILIVPDFGIATPDAYERLDLYRKVNCVDYSDAMSDESMTQMYYTPVKSWTFDNAFIPILYDTYPEYMRIKTALYASGAGFVTISGSGSSMIGIFEDREIDLQALIAESSLQSIKVIPIKMLAVQPKAVYN